MMLSSVKSNSIYHFKNCNMATTKKRVWNTPYNYEYTKYKEAPMPPSETTPDMALTIPEIIKRYASGRSVNVPVYEDYGGDDEHLTGVDVRTLDISEIHDLVETTKTNLAKLQDENNRRIKEDQDKKLEESIIEKFKKRQEAEKAENKPVYIQTELPIQKPEKKE